MKSARSIGEVVARICLPELVFNHALVQFSSIMPFSSIMLVSVMDENWTNSGSHVSKNIMFVFENEAFKYFIEKNYQCLIDCDIYDIPEVF
jgi:hypothetical protein